MRNRIFLLILVVFLGLIFASSGLADLYIVKDQEGEIVAISNQDIFKAEYQELGYTFDLWFKAKTPTLDSLIKLFEGQLTETQEDIKILDWTNYLDGNYHYVEGILKNIGRSTVKYLQVKVICLDKAGRLVSLKERYANPYDLAPGQEATFKIMIKHNSRIDSFDLKINWEYD